MERNTKIRAEMSKMETKRTLQRIRKNPKSSFFYRNQIDELSQIKEKECEDPNQ
jgi:hypothetical protein